MKLIIILILSCTQRIKMTEEEIDEIVYTLSKKMRLCHSASDEILSKLPKLSEKGNY